MDFVYRMNFDVLSTDTDRYNRLKASSILSMMQEAATRQCLELDLGWDAMAEKRLFWAVTRQHIRITRLPKAGSTLTVETWPGVTTRVAYPRSTIAYDEEGNELFRAISLWVLMNMDTRALVLPKKSGIDFSGIDRGGELPVPASLGPVCLSGQTERQVVFSELDCNGHMSNTRYLDWMTDLLPSEFHQRHPLAEFTVSYLSEAREGEKVCLSYELSPEGQLRLEATQGESTHRVFAVKAVYNTEAV